MRLSLLAQRSKELINKFNLQSFYDVYCDHGYLGMEVLRSSTVNVIFIDQVQHIIDNLKDNIASYITSGNIKLICSKAEKINYQTQSIISLTGVGTDTILKCINSVDYKLNGFLVICPNNKTLELRKELLIKKSYIINNELIADNNRFYEVLIIGLGKYKSCIPHPIIGDYNDNHNFALYLQKHQNYYNKRVKYQNCSKSKDILNLINHKIKEIY